MATVNFIPCSKQCTSSMKNEIVYVMQNKKVCIDREKLDCDHTINYQTYAFDADIKGSIHLVSGKDCCPETAFAEFMATKNTFRKANDVMFYHYTQSFKDGETISPKTAHEIAVKFAEDNYPDFEVVVATHVDNEHLHSHFIINSVSFKTGKKLHDGPNTLQKLRAYSDQICQQYGLSTLPPYQGGKSQNPGAREYRAAAKGESWKFALMNTIDHAMRISRTKAEFTRNMERKGYEVKWTDARKSITYTCPNKMQCRDNKLHDPRYLKERMEREFEYRRAEAEKLQRAAGEHPSDVATSLTATAAQPQPIDTGETGQSILQSAADFGLGSGCAEADRISAKAAPQPCGAERIVTHQTESATHTGRAGENRQDTGTTPADDFTGWEAEREILFHPELALAEDSHQSDVATVVPNIGGVVGDVVRLGKAVERLGNDVPIKDATTKPQPHTGKKKKLAVGQKEDDHSGYDFTMTM